MLIREMSRQASLDLLARAPVGRLACAHEGQPYITPINYVFDDNYLYCFTTLGQKIAWMRENPLVCMEVEELAGLRDWATVIVFGKYEELPDTPEYKEARQRAHELLQRRPAWWEPGGARTVVDGKMRPLEPCYFRIRVDRISGRRATPTASDGDVVAGYEVRVGWLRKILGRPGPKRGGR